jgi:UDP-2,4-diacetamido-2,4,6-trideoxy-beta-L-altropyranose hydrolase
VKSKSISIYLSYGGSIGLGHLKRMLSVAGELKTEGYTVYFLTRKLSPDNTSIITAQGFIESNLVSTQEDSLAQCIVATLKNAPSVETLIVDDYAVSESIEIAVIDAGYRLVVVDDLMRRHQAGMVIDSKWRGEGETQRAYDGLVPVSCKCLLGPNYYLFDPAYCDEVDIVEKVGPQDCLSILLSLGGMPDLVLLKQIAKELLIAISPHYAIDIIPVVGAQKKGVEPFLQFCDEYNLKPVVEANSLRDHYRSSDLFVGAAGGSIYEAMLSGIPAVTFILADNQWQECALFEEIGHNHHFNRHYAVCKEEIFTRIIEIFSAYEQSVELLETFRNYYDCMGVKRVAQSILEYDCGSIA